MMKKMLKWMLFYLCSTAYVCAEIYKVDEIERLCSKCIISTTQIHIPGHPKAFNPSILKVDKGFLLSFRVEYDVDHIGLVYLSENFEILSSPKLLPIGKNPHDSRLFFLKEEIFLFFNDATSNDCRKMFFSKIHITEEGHFICSPPLKLLIEGHHDEFPMEKNWVPFEYEGELYCSYFIIPHMILKVDILTGVCHFIYNTGMMIQWPLGQMRGGTPANLIDGEYLAFFHSSTSMCSIFQDQRKRKNYYMSAYVFSAEPPFEVTKIIPFPLCHESFYKKASRKQRVVFPCGYVNNGNAIYISYGVDDEEIWIAKINLEELQKIFVPVQA